MYFGIFCLKSITVLNPPDVSKTIVINQLFHLTLLFFSVNIEDGCSRRLKYLFKMVTILILQYSRVLLRFFRDKEKKMCKNQERSTAKLKKKKSQLMFDETCFKKNICHNYIKRTITIYYNYLQCLSRFTNKQF